MQGLDLQPQNLTISSGCGAIINNLLYCITEPGEGIALPAPYYPAFDYDIKVSASTSADSCHLCTKGTCDL